MPRWIPYLFALLLPAGGSPAAEVSDRGAGRESMLRPVAAGVVIRPLLDAGEAVAGYRMSGVGDGIGVYGIGRDRAIVVMNHELGSASGVARRHGARGAFVSRWVLDTAAFEIVAGEDLIQAVIAADGAVMTAPVLDRLCSGDLPLPAALHVHTAVGFLGTAERLFFSGEELTTKYKDATGKRRHGRAFAHVLTGDLAGTSYELPHLGKLAFENIVLSPATGRRTVAALLDDATNRQYDRRRIADQAACSRQCREAFFAQVDSRPPSELYFYLGAKQAGGATPVERAGLTNGALYGVQIGAGVHEDRQHGYGTNEYRSSAAFSLVKLGDLSADPDGRRLQRLSIERGVSQFLRLEDGAWNTVAGRQNEFYFATTDRYRGNTRLHRLRFNDIRNPEAGGTIDIVLEGRARGMEMLDNLAVDPWGRVLLQEDAGSSPRLSRIWLYEPAHDRLTWLAEAEPSLFSPLAGWPLTMNEETSGIVAAFDPLGEGWYLLNVQAHADHPDEAIVEHGQLLAMQVPRGIGQLPEKTGVPVPQAESK